MPQIDVPSINADISVVRLRTYLNQSNGFIAREDVPDKGCDFDVELILDHTDVSNWRFAVQLKSVQNLKTVDNGKYVSYSFETSRLGYLMRRLPGMGIIALYSVERDCLYYELVENIYQRLNDERDGDQWKEKNTVNIRFPIENILNESSTATLHTMFCNRFQSAARLFQSQAASYDLPVVGHRTNLKDNLNNTDAIVEALKEFGVALLSAYDLEPVYSMVTKLSMRDINASKDLQIVAAMAYCEAGNHAEAGYYFGKLEKRDDIAPQEKPMIDFSKLKNSFALGNVGFLEFMKQCEALLSPEKNLLNDVTLILNLHYSRLLTLKPLEEIPGTLLEEISDNYHRIEHADGDSKLKALFEIWNTDNLGFLMSNIRSKAYERVKLLEAMNMPLSAEERVDEVRKQLAMEMLLQQRLEKLKVFAIETSDNLLYANVVLSSSRHRLSHELDIIAFHVSKQFGEEERGVILKHNIDQAVLGYQLFLQERRYKESYHALFIAVEFIILATEYYEIAENFRLDALREAQKQLEAELGLPSYHSAVQDLINSVSHESARIPSVSNYAFLSDEMIEYVAKLVLERRRLPLERMANVVAEMKAYRLFFLRCKNPSLEMVLYDPLRTIDNRYESPTRFVIRSKTTGIRTNPSSDVESLLSFWSL